MGNKLRVTAMTGALAFCALATLPSIGHAFSTGLSADPVSLSARGGIGSFTPASVDPRLAADLKINKLNAIKSSRVFKFTPATDAGEDIRSVTVAVRMRDKDSKAVQIRQAGNLTAGTGDVLKITPNAYSLGVAKGWQKFALPDQVTQLKVPDLAALGKTEPVVDPTDRPSRFNSRIALDNNQQIGIAPRTYEGESSYSVDVSGSYSLSSNLDVTAGVRIRDERDRLAPLTDERRDSQAVYVGTQFRF